MKSSLACKQPRKSAGERGQALLELLPVMVVLLMMTFAVIDLSRAIWQLQVITGLTREGSNLASRNTPLPDSVTAVISDGAVLNLGGYTNGLANGKVIITSVQNKGGAFVITGQWPQGFLVAASKIGTYDPKVTTLATNLPVTPTTIPQPGGTIYVTEIFNRFSPITPIGSFGNYVRPSTLYDVAYF